jgi:ABC-type sugar transport system ATPase subunit
LGEKEVDILFSVIRKLKAQGKAIIYVSHRMEEIFTITDKITVLRDGKYIGTVATEGTPRAQVITMMIGEKLDENFVKYNKTTETVMMSAEHICQEGIIDDVSLDVRKGEIIGLFGLMGSGRSEFCDAFFGVSKIDSGKFVIEGNDVMINCPKDAMKRDIAYVTEDRKDSGLDLLQSVKYNISLADLQDLSDGFLINKKRENKATQAIVDELSIKTPSLDQLVMNLSGGNQQKVVFGKWIVRKPRILILDEPTRGIDVKAKHEIYKFMSQFADAGKSIIFISSEIPEILMMSDRIFVFNKGKIAARLKRGEANQNNLMYYASVTEKTREYEKNGNGKEFR